MYKKSQHESKDSNFQRKPTSRRNHIVERNLKKQYKKTRSSEGIGKREWPSMGGQWSGIHGRKNLCSKQPEDSRTSSIGKS